MIPAQFKKKSLFVSQIFYCRTAHLTHHKVNKHITSYNRVIVIPRISDSRTNDAGRSDTKNGGVVPGVRHRVFSYHHDDTDAWRCRPPVDDWWSSRTILRIVGSSIRLVAVAAAATITAAVTKLLHWRWFERRSSHPYQSKTTTRVLLGRMKIDNGINNLVPGRWSCLVSCTIFLLPIRVLAFGIRIMWSNNDSNDDRIELTEMMMYALRGYDETKRHDTTQHDANH